ncbi:aminotransferase class I/II-fold pyridoxal phosphate-dependent enzyme [Microbacterium azadirachtae]|uniref:Arginine decarboxylase n=1 Tax=Microbacterium azadirachtae TaxID=582680 RepID=A0A0F0LGM5_9MICO|nr:aminotransferase class V-fold PLP-dependent enzyme [Microbacterium azadirachtae]KJL32283.1 Arginine decarboxylase [Microbacterium azadirachtae]
MTTTTPYADAIRRFAARDLQRLNVPGHSADPAAAPLLADFFGDDVLRYDVEPLLDGIDKGSDNPLEEAREAAARAWGARRTWFLTNGASEANRMTALALAAFRTPDEIVVAQRSAHSSFFDGIILGGLDPRFVTPTIDEHHGINHGVTPAAMRDALEGADAKAAYIISPSYFGAVADVEGIAAVCHEAGVPLVVDAAWAAHFGFHPELPANPIALGADLVVSSTHKMGGSLTQSAMLHLAEGPYAEELEPLLDRAFLFTQSTSASSLLLASLDLARATLEDGHDRLAASLAAAAALRDAVRATGRFPIVSDGFDAFPDIVGHDPLRVSIDVGAAGLHGHTVREELLRSAGIMTEISTGSCIVAFVGPGTTPDPARFVAALEALQPVGDLAARGDAGSITLPKTGPAVMRPRDAAFAHTEIVSAEDAVGRVSADSLAAYPPGIPNVLPGEILTAETISFLRGIAATPGGYVRGAADALVDGVRVVVEESERRTLIRPKTTRIGSADARSRTGLRRAATPSPVKEQVTA